MVSPCIGVLRRLVTQIQQDLGSMQGTSHTTPDLQKDINLLKMSLREHNVYGVEAGRIIETDDSSNGPVVANALSAGLLKLSGALIDYNKLFSRLQTQSQMKPLVGEVYHSTPTATSAEPTVQTPEHVALQTIVNSGGYDDSQGDNEAFDEDSMRDQFFFFDTEMMLRWTWTLFSFLTSNLFIH